MSDDIYEESLKAYRDAMSRLYTSTDNGSITAKMDYYYKVYLAAFIDPKAKFDEELEDL
jgi:hypothetical protein